MEKVLCSICIVVCAGCAGVPAVMDSPAPTMSLARVYPAALGASDPAPPPKQWRFQPEDMYVLTEFRLTPADRLAVDCGPSYLGVGHTADGAVWAVVKPLDPGHLSAGGHESAEVVDHIWLRFHPARIGELFPPGTVTRSFDRDVFREIERIAAFKIFGSYQARGQAVIPPMGEMTVDISVRNGPRRFFAVNLTERSCRYYPSFETHDLSQPKPITREEALTSFDRVWREYDESYAMFAIRPEVDWRALRDRYRPRAGLAATNLEFARICAEMLAHLKDLHIWVTVTGENVPVYSRERRANGNMASRSAILDNLGGQDGVQWAVTPESVGYIAIDRWSHPGIPDIVDDILEDMRATRGVILDVRFNGGGSEPLAQAVAGRFADQVRVYAYSRIRSGPGHDDLTGMRPRTVGPSGPWRYDRPVIVLAGQLCLSSNESFVAMMSTFPQVTVMGEPTGGSSGNPVFVELPMGVKISLPQWIDYRPDKQPLDGRGIEPDILFEVSNDGLTSARDDLLAAALDRLSGEPLPVAPIPGALDEREPARIVSVYPENDSENVPLTTVLNIGFDQPVNPDMWTLVLRDAGLRLSGLPDYNAETMELNLPVILTPGKKYILAFTRRSGFTDMAGRPVEGFTWRFTAAEMERSEDASAPRVVSVTPAPGSDVSRLTRVTIRFDQPMNPLAYNAPGTAFGRGKQAAAQVCPEFDYDAEQYEFSIPVFFQTDTAETLVFDGFAGRNGMPADPVTVTYAAGEELLSPDVAELLDRERRNPELQSILNSMKSARETLSDARVNMVWTSSGGANGFGFQFTKRSSAQFAFSGEKRLLADVSGIMGHPFVVGSDGDTAWNYMKASQAAAPVLLLTVPEKKMQHREIGILNPMNLLGSTVEEVLAGQNLEYRGRTIIQRVPCHVIRRWTLPEYHENARSRAMMLETFYIRTDNYLIHHLHQLDFRGMVNEFEFAVDPLPGDDRDDVFRMREDTEADRIDDFAANEHISEEMLGYFTEWFTRVYDGSDGRVSVRFGKYSEDGKMLSNGLE